MSPVPGSARIEQLAQAVAERVVTLVMDAIDINAILARIDVDGLVDRVDVEKVVERVDVEKVVERIDVEKIVERIDVQKIVEQVDIEKILEQVDIDALIERTEIGNLIVKSTSGVASEALDAVRASSVGLDDFVARWVNRILRRKAAELPSGPATLVATGKDPTGPAAAGTAPKHIAGNGVTDG